MALNAGASISAGLQAAVALVADIEKAVAAGGGITAEGIDLVELVLADANFKSSLSALIAAL